MKKTSLLLVFSLCIVSLFAQNYTIHGHMNHPAYQGKKLYCLNAMTGALLDSVVIRDGLFQLQLQVDEPYVASLQTEKISRNNYYYINLVAEPGTVYCDMVTDSISGTPLNDRYAAFLRYCKYQQSVYRAYMTQLTESVNPPADVEEELGKNLQNVLDLMADHTRQTYLENKNDAVGALTLDYLADLQTLEYDALKELFQQGAPVVQSYIPLNMKMKQAEILANTAIGKPYIDLELTDYRTGERVKLSKYIDGKIALVDFWASWCRPCRAEIPNIANIYKKYGKDVVVISLDVWDKADAQAKAIREMKMDWIQLSDETSNATDTYGIDGIPHIMLIGADGTIIARDLRGDEIETAVKKALK